MRFYGEHHQISEFTTPHLELGEIDGQMFAIIASGICRANAYYRAPYDGGAAYLLIQDENFPVCQEPPLARLLSVFPQAISSIEIPDHRLALIGYLDYHGIGFEETVSQVVVKENGEEVLTATFDEQKRLTNLEARIDAAKASRDTIGRTVPVNLGS